MKRLCICQIVSKSFQFAKYFFEVVIYCYSFFFGLNSCISDTNTEFEKTNSALFTFNDIGSTTDDANGANFNQNDEHIQQLMNIEMYEYFLKNK